MHSFCSSRSVDKYLPLATCHLCLYLFIFSSVFSYIYICCCAHTTLLLHECVDSIWYLRNFPILFTFIENNGISSSSKLHERVMMQSLPGELLGWCCYGDEKNVCGMWTKGATRVLWAAEEKVASVRRWKTWIWNY